MQPQENALVSDRQEVIDNLAKLAQEEHAEYPDHDPSYLIWRATDKLRGTFADITRSEQEKAFQALIKIETPIQRAYHAALNSDDPDLQESAGRLGGHL